MPPTDTTATATATSGPSAAAGEPLALITELADDLATHGLAAATHHHHDDGLTPIAELLSAIDRLVAVVVTVLIAADHQTVIAAQGLTTASWLRAVARRTGADAGMLLAAAQRLADMPATLTAFQTGVLSWGTIRGIVTATRSLTGAQRAWVDATLAADPDRLARVDGDTVIGDTQTLADRARPDLHTDRAGRAAAAQQLVVQPTVDGTGGTLFAVLDAEGFAAVTAAIDGITRDSTGRRVASNVDALRALARQRVTLTTDTDDEDPVEDPDGLTTDSRHASTGTVASDAPRGGAGDTDSGGGTRRPTRPAPSTARPEMIIVTDITMLTDPDLDRSPYVGIDRRGADTLTVHDAARGVAKILWRHDRPAPRLTRHAARRLACDATWRPVLVDEHGRVLGTAEPYAKVSTPLRAALAARDGGCRFPACHAPVEVCDAHHLQHRADGGPTVLANLALLCSRHHRAVHDGGWTPALHITTGQMTFTRRGTTLHSHARLPTTSHTDTSDTGPPPPGRPRRHRTTNPANDPPATPLDQTAPPDRPHTAQPAAPLPF